jgi:Glycosyltransferase family 87
VTRLTWWRAGAALATLGGAELVAQAVRGWRFVEHSDYVAVATAGRILGAGSSCVYCPPVEARAQARLLGHPPDIGVMLYANPPPAAWLLRPLAALPLRTGAAVFLAASLVALVAAAALLRRLLPSGQASRWRLVVAGCAVSIPPGVSALAYVQWDPLLLLAASGAVVLAPRRDGPLAGALLSVLLVKPQLVWLAVPALLLGGHRRTLVGLLAGGCAWLAGSVAAVGPGGLVDWYRSVLAMGVGDSGKTAGVPGLLVQLTGRSAVALPATLLCALGAVALLWRVRSRLRADRSLALAAGLALSLLTAPHVFGGDLLLLAPLLVLVGRRRPEVAIAAAVGLEVTDLLQRTAPGVPSHALGLMVVAAMLAAGLGGLRAPGAAPGAARTLVGSA